MGIGVECDFVSELVDDDHLLLDDVLKLGLFYRLVVEDGLTEHGVDGLAEFDDFSGLEFLFVELVLQLLNPTILSLQLSL